MPFNEVTYSDGDDEIMVHFEVGSRIPSRVYCYRDSPMAKPEGLEGIEKGLTWEPEPRNPLFLNASDPVKALRQIRRHGYVRDGD